MAEIDRSIPFVDAYHHVTEPSRNPYDWLTEDGAIYTDYLGDYKLARADWSMDRLLREFYGSNVTKSVHIEAAWSGSDPVDETRYLAAVTAECGMPNAYVVFCDMTGGDARQQLDAHLAASPLVRGVRIRQHPELGGDAVFLDNLKACAERGLHFEFACVARRARPRACLCGRSSRGLVRRGRQRHADVRVAAASSNSGAVSWMRWPVSPTSAARSGVSAWCSTGGPWNRSARGC